LKAARKTQEGEQGDFHSKPPVATGELENLVVKLLLKAPHIVARRNLRILQRVKRTTMSIHGMEDAHALTVQQVLQHFDANPATGLSPSQVEIALSKYGRNGMPSSLPYMPCLMPFDV
jgi:hypothetical protein